MEAVVVLDVLVQVVDKTSNAAEEEEEQQPPQRQQQPPQRQPTSEEVVGLVSQFQNWNQC